jgi:metallo-beta-lactamase family protein
VKITFYGGIDSVTGSCTHLHYELTGIRFLVDCGMIQGGMDQDFENLQPFPFDPKSLKYVLLTHAHLDHCGLLPRLYKEGFVGKVVCTRATAKLAHEVLLDSATIVPNSLYSGSDVKKVRYHHLDDRDDFSWGKLTRLDDDLRIYAHRSAHILGACGFGVSWKEDQTWKSIFFSGDVGPTSETFSTSYLLKDTQGPYDSTDYVVMESTKGEGTHLLEQSCEERLEGLRSLVRNEVVNEKRKLLIPAFSIHRMQEVLYDLIKIADEGIEGHQAEERLVYADVESLANRFKQGFALTEFMKGFEELNLPEEELRAVLSIIQLRNKKLTLLAELKGHLNEDGFLQVSDVQLIVDLLSRCKTCQVYASDVHSRRLADVFSKLKKVIRVPVRCEAVLGDAVNKIFAVELLKTGAKGKYLYIPDTEDDERLAAFRSILNNRLAVGNFTFSTSAKVSGERNISKYPCITLSSSGMCEGGIIVNHLRHALFNEDFTIVLTGYQAPGTNGSKLLSLMNDAKYEATLFLNGDEISTQDVKAKIVFFGGYSGHATPSNIIENHLSCLTAENKHTVFLNHGTAGARKSFQKMICADDRTKHLDVVLPGKGDTYILSGSTLSVESALDSRSVSGASELVDILRQINQNLVEIKALLKKN